MRTCINDFLHFISAALNFLWLLHSISDSQGAEREDFLGLEDRGQRRSMNEEREKRKVLVAESRRDRLLQVGEECNH